MTSKQPAIPVEFEQAWQLRDSQPHVAVQMLENWLVGPYKPHNQVLRAYTHWRRGEMTEAMSLVTEAISALRLEQPSIWLGRALGILAPIEGHLSRPDTAMELYAEEVQVARILDNKILEGQASLGMGVILRLQEQYEHSRFHLRQALQSFSQAEDDRGVSFSYLNLGIISRKTKSNYEALDYLEKALDYDKLTEMPSLEAMIRCSYATSLDAIGQTQKAEQQDEVLHKLFEKLPNLEDKVDILLVIHRNAVATDVIKVFEPLIVEVQKMGEHNCLPQIYRKLSKAYEDLSQYQLSLKYLKLAMEFEEKKHDSIRKLQIETLEVLQRIKFWQDIAKKEQQKSSRLKKLVEELQVSNAKIAQLVKTDSLTGLYNRHHLFEKGEAYTSQSTPDFSVGVAIMDIDHFKDINDTYGHLCGDTVLKIIATIIREYSLFADIVSRYGGEEFVLLRTGTTLSDLHNTATLLLQRVREYNWQQTAPNLKVTLSIGIAVTEQKGNFENLLQVADKRLYVAKNSGRNCIIFQGNVPDDSQNRK